MKHPDEPQDTPEWQLPPRECDGSADYVRELTIPDNITLGAE